MRAAPRPKPLRRISARSATPDATAPLPARSIHGHRDPCPSCGPLALCRGREGQKRKALTGRDDGVRIQGEVEPEGQRDSAQVPKGLMKKFVGGRTMYVPKYDHAKAGGDGWDWLW